MRLRKVDWNERAYMAMYAAGDEIRKAIVRHSTDPVLSKAHLDTAIRKANRALKALDSAKKAQP